LPVEELSVLYERQCVSVRSRLRYAAYGLTALGVAWLWLYAFQSTLPAPKALLPRVPSASSGSIEVIPAVRRAGHSSVAARTVRHGSAVQLGRAAVGATTVPTGRTHIPPLSARTGKPKGPGTGTPAPGGTTPPTTPGGTTPPSTPGGTTPPTSPSGPVASPPVDTPPSPPSGGDVGGGGSGSSGSDGTPTAAPTDGGRTTSGIPPVHCASANGAVTNASIVVSNGVATATFHIAAGCSDIAITLGTYQTPSTPPTLFRTVSGSFDAGGAFTLSAAVPTCQYEADLMAGNVTLASASGGASCTPPPQPLPPPPPPLPPCDHGTGQGDHPGGGGLPPGGTDTRPGWGWRDNNHDHTGPGGGSGHKGSP
jgi:hypothetical protein